MKKKITYIDLFSGCGGLSLGLHNSGLEGIMAVEKNPDAFLTLKTNLMDNSNHFKWPKSIPKKNYDIDYLLKNYKIDLLKLKGKVDLITGGPPCQGFSTAGRREESDKRNSLVNSYLKFVEIVDPKIILFENVLGFTQKFENNKKKKGSKIYSQYVIQKLEQLDYSVDHSLIDFSEFGVPQKRRRFILVATKNITNNFFELLPQSFKKVRSKYGLKNKTTVREALSDLCKTNGTDFVECCRFQHGRYSKSTSAFQRYSRKGMGQLLGEVADSHRFPNHKKEIINRFKKIIRISHTKRITPKLLREKFGIRKHSISVLKEQQPSPTLTTLPDDLLHYVEPRILTVREYARLQTFPDWYQFCGKYTTGGKMRVKEVPRYSQIGNAIPPLFGEVCGSTILTLFSNESKR